MRNKSQISIEFLAIVAFAFILIASTSYYFLSFLSDTEDDISLAQATGIGENILIHVRDAQGANGYYKKTIHVSSPESIKSIESENTNLIIKIDTGMGSGSTDLVLRNDFIISTQVIPEKISAGVYTIEKTNNIIVVCTGTSCECDLIESGNVECYDGIDNDCNGYLDDLDVPCLGIPTSPPPTASYLYGYAYSENAGYISFYSPRYWVEVSGTDLTGYAYGENFGYISFQGPGYGVILDGNDLKGYAYSENMGYIVFNGTNHQVIKNGNNLEGYAYSENAGFISFNSTNHQVKYQS